MKRRAFLSAIATFFALKPTTTLVAAGPECSTVATIPVDASMTLCLDEYTARYLRPAMASLIDSIDRQVLLGRRYHYGRLEDYERRFNPARLPW